MKKISVITQAKDAQALVDELRQLGVVHVAHQQEPKGQNLEALTQELALVREALAILSIDELQPKKKHDTTDVPADCHDFVQHVNDAWRRVKQVREYAHRVRMQIEEWGPWGEFDPQQVKKLAEKNIFLHYIITPVKELALLPSDAVVKVITKKSGMAYCVVIMRDDVTLPVKPRALPEQSLAQMKKRLDESDRLLVHAQDDLRKRIACRTWLHRTVGRLEKEIEFAETLAGMGTHETLHYVSGYAPTDALDRLAEAARTHAWAFCARDPLPDEAVPTLLRNPRWVSIIAPIFKAIEIIPGYHEFDASVWFLLFLSVFFGMLIGDAAYGLIFFGLTAWVHIKYGKKLPRKAVFVLMYVFSSCAIAWGVLSGTFFGQAWLPQWVQPLFPALRNDGTVQTLCFFLGALHLSIAHGWRAIVKLPSLVALTDIGWLSIVWGCFFLARTLILGAAFPMVAQWFLVMGVVFVILFTNTQKNILKTIGSGLGNLLLNIVNNFTDIVSYIRLFAVGLATVAVADAFNKMAMETAGAASIAAFALSALILFIGHALNIILGPMAVLVHGVRLNVLEFSNHLGVKWSGFEYQPFKKSIA